MPTLLSIFLLTYAAVIAVEIAGDRSLYTVASLAARFRPLPVLAGVAAAVTCKMAVAVLLGRTILLLPEGLVRGVAVATILGAAVLVWRGEDGGAGAPQTAPEGRGTHPVVLAFVAVFLTEWADPGQLTAATLSVRYDAPVIVWIAASLAVSTKAVFAATAGVVLRRWVPRNVLRGVAVAGLLGMAVLVALGVST
ncbi:MAG TPA: TMEM165/GDT1 family protein [Longimicrobium sp.]|nr:TMEM165/GDT1 family protein [Longimicrobium sp.]